MKHRLECKAIEGAVCSWSDGRVRVCLGISRESRWETDFHSSPSHLDIQLHILQRKGFRKFFSILGSLKQSPGTTLPQWWSWEGSRTCRCSPTATKRLCLSLGCSTGFRLETLQRYKVLQLRTPYHCLYA